MVFYKVRCPKCTCTFEMEGPDVVVPDTFPSVSPHCNCGCHENGRGINPRKQVKVFVTKEEMQAHTKMAARLSVQ